MGNHNEEGSKHDQGPSMALFKKLDKLLWNYLGEDGWTNINLSIFRTQVLTYISSGRSGTLAHHFEQLPETS